jgi:fucose 4-O-acetylase-like acetyltransferase
VTISEPMTLLTDYVLGAVTAWLGFLLWKQRDRHISRLFWCIAFAALALGALLGGTWHGFVRSEPLWIATLVVVGIASCAMVVGSLFATLTGAPRNILLWLAAGKLLFYLNWLLERTDFRVVIIDSAIAFAMVLALHLWRFNGWIVAGILVSVAAALVQASGFAPHPHFNHNDLYHVIQIAAMALLYRGARRLTDAGALG